MSISNFPSFLIGDFLRLITCIVSKQLSSACRVARRAYRDKRLSFARLDASAGSAQVRFVTQLWGLCSPGNHFYA